MQAGIVALLGLLAHAGEPSARARVVVLPPAVEGDLPAARQQELADALRGGLRRGEFDVLDAPADTTCRTPDCAGEVARAVGADYAVTMTVGVERRDYAIALDLVDASSGRSTAHSEQRCEVCGIAEAREIVDDQATRLRTRLDALSVEAPTVAFESTPSGAIVRLDGKVVGETPFERPVEPGQHRAEASKDGYVAETREFEAVAGVGSTIRFELDPVPRSVRYRKLRGFGWSALGIGAASVVTGIVLVAIDGKPNTVSCTGENVDPRGNCKFLYATLEPGIAVTAIGVALVATGIGIGVATRDRPARRARLDVGPRGLAISGRF